MAIGAREPFVQAISHPSLVALGPWKLARTYFWALTLPLLVVIGLAWMFWDVAAMVSASAFYVGAVIVLSSWCRRDPYLPSRFWHGMFAKRHYVPNAGMAKRV